MLRRKRSKGKILRTDFTPELLADAHRFTCHRARHLPPHVSREDLTQTLLLHVVRNVKRGAIRADAPQIHHLTTAWWDTLDEVRDQEHPASRRPSRRSPPPLPLLPGDEHPSHRDPDPTATRATDAVFASALIAHLTARLSARDCLIIRLRASGLTLAAIAQHPSLPHPVTESRVSQVLTQAASHARRFLAA